MKFISRNNNYSVIMTSYCMFSLFYFIFPFPFDHHKLFILILVAHKLEKIAKRVYVGECAGSRSVGRPRKRWIDTVKECLKRRGLDVRQARRWYWVMKINNIYIYIYGGGL